MATSKFLHKTFNATRDAYIYGAAKPSNKSAEKYMTYDIMHEAFSMSTRDRSMAASEPITLADKKVEKCAPATSYLMTLVPDNMNMLVELLQHSDCSSLIRLSTIITNTRLQLVKPENYLKQAALERIANGDLHEFLNISNQFATFDARRALRQGVIDVGGNLVLINIHIAHQYSTPSCHRFIENRIIYGVIQRDDLIEHFEDLKKVGEAMSANQSNSIVCRCQRMYSDHSKPQRLCKPLVAGYVNCAHCEIFVKERLDNESEICLEIIDQVGKFGHCLIELNQKDHPITTKIHSLWTTPAIN
jgi:hypothetical protein